MLYALFGLPWTCLTLKSIGDKITELFINSITNFEKRILKRSHLTQKVELKVALTTAVVTVVCLLPLMALLVHVRHKEWSCIECFFLYFHDFEYNLVLVITCRNLRTTLITHLYFWRLWVSLSYRAYFAQ